MPKVKHEKIIYVIYIFEKGMDNGILQKAFLDEGLAASYMTKMQKSLPNTPIKKQSVYLEYYKEA